METSDGLETLSPTRLEHIFQKKYGWYDYNLRCGGRDIASIDIIILTNYWKEKGYDLPNSFGEWILSPIKDRHEAKNLEDIIYILYILDDLGESCIELFQIEFNKYKFIIPTEILLLVVYCRDYIGFYNSCIKLFDLIYTNYKDSIGDSDKEFLINLLEKLVAHLEIIDDQSPNIFLGKSLINKLEEGLGNYFKPGKISFGDKININIKTGVIAFMQQNGKTKYISKEIELENEINSFKQHEFLKKDKAYKSQNHKKGIGDKNYNYEGMKAYTYGLLYLSASIYYTSSLLDYKKEATTIYHDKKNELFILLLKALGTMYNKTYHNYFTNINFDIGLLEKCVTYANDIIRYYIGEDIVLKNRPKEVKYKADIEYLEKIKASLEKIVLQK